MKHQEVSFHTTVVLVILIISTVILTPLVIRCLTISHPSNFTSDYSNIELEKSCEKPTTAVMKYQCNSIDFYNTTAKEVMKLLVGNTQPPTN